MAKAEEKHEPIRQSVHVECPAEDAFRLFTERFSQWWPGEDASQWEMEPGEGGRIIERTPSGEEREWGEVTRWDPPRRVEFTWHPGRSAGEQRVEVEFRTEADGTRVTLTHRGWHLAGVAVSFAQFASAQMRAVVYQEARR